MYVKNSKFMCANFSLETKITEKNQIGNLVLNCCFMLIKKVKGMP